MDKKTSKLIDETFRKADETFARADEVFKSVHWYSPSSGTISGNETVEFEAPDWPHRWKLCRLFLKLSWRMLRTGNVKFTISKRKCPNQDQTSSSASA